MYERFIVQGIMCDSLIIEEMTVSEEERARQAAKDMLNRLDFEGDSVRIITLDGERVWSGKVQKR